MSFKPGFVTVTEETGFSSDSDKKADLSADKHSSSDEKFPPNKKRLNQDKPSTSGTKLN